MTAPGAPHPTNLTLSRQVPTGRERRSDGDGEPGSTTSRFRVRPYTLTGGRTRTEVDLGLETQVRTTEQGRRRVGLLALESQDIVEICRDPLSVAEVSAHLGVPLQVAKVLVGDLITSGDIESNDGGAGQDASGRPDIQLLERVLEGLQSL